MTKPNDVAAFPSMIPSNWEEKHPGMSLRDYFAAQVLPGCCAGNPEPGLAAQRAYEIADAMLAERAKA